MFISLTVLDEGKEFVIDINLMHITSVEPTNPRNPDSSAWINLRDSRAYETVDPRYEVMNKINRGVEQYAGVIMVSFLAESMTIQKPPVKRTRKKTTK